MLTHRFIGGNKTPIPAGVTDTPENVPAAPAGLNGLCNAPARQSIGGLVADIPAGMNQHKAPCWGIWQ